MHSLIFSLVLPSTWHAITQWILQAHGFMLFRSLFQGHPRIHTWRPSLNSWSNQHFCPSPTAWGCSQLPCSTWFVITAFITVWHIHTYIHTHTYTYTCIHISQSLSCIQFFETPWTAACQASPSVTVSRSLLKLMSIESVMPPNHLILYCYLFLLPSIFPSSRIFSNELALGIRWPNYWSFSFNASPSNVYSGLISFKIEWFDIFAVHCEEAIILAVGELSQ